MTTKTDTNERSDLRLEAANMIAKTVAAQPSRLARFKEAHEADCASYSFRCERHGDFLAVFVTRGPAPDPTQHWAQPNKLVAAINLMASKAVTLNPGHDPDLCGTARFGLSYDYPTKVDGLTDHSAKPKRSVVAKYENDWSGVRTQMISVPDQPSTGGHMMHYSSGRYEGEEHIRDITVPAAARAAEDDTVIFSAHGVTLYAPSGHGRAIFDAVIGATA